MIKKLLTLLKMGRIGNALLASIGIMCGCIFTDNSLLSINLLLLIVAGATALAFGNVINDIFDIETDRISHPNRPLVTGEISKKIAIVFATILASISMFSGFSVSINHGIATLLPIIILALYAIKLKGTPLSGNIVVSLLVAYTIIFGALGGSLNLVVIPAILAFLANLNREIVKDLQDYEGDKVVGLKTTATLSKKVINSILIISTLLFIIIALLPIYLKILGNGYTVVTLVFVIPLSLFSVKLYSNNKLNSTSLLLKFEMLFGLIALFAAKIRF